MKDISKLSVQEVCSYIACMNKLVEEKIVIFKPNKAFIKFNYDKATRHLEKQNIEQKEEIERLKKREQECIDHYLVQCKYASEMEKKYISANYIINELEKWLEEDLKEVYRDAGYRHKLILEVLDKLHELKGSEK